MNSTPVLTLNDVCISELRRLLGRYELSLVIQAGGSGITGSYWGDPEAGIAGSTVYARSDTPVHSVLHETCHIICMDERRRKLLDQDAGGDDIEEAAVCYLQIVLADCVDRVGAARLAADMDAWGYSFRLGSTARWFAEDADDARAWLIGHGVLTVTGRPSFDRRS